MSAAGRPRCAEDYQRKLSGPLLDRIDMHIQVPNVSPADLDLPPSAEGSRKVAVRIEAARARQNQRYNNKDSGQNGGGTVRLNAQADGRLLEAVLTLDDDGRALLRQASERIHLSARGDHRVLRVARTLADLEEAEALSYRRLRTVA